MVACPECKTSYTPERLGITLGSIGQMLTVKCLVCGVEFEAHIEPRATTPTWYQRFVKGEQSALVHDVKTRHRTR